MTEENSFKKKLEERSLKDILEEIDAKDNNTSDSSNVCENPNVSPTPKHELSKEDAQKEIKKAFARLSKINNGVLEDMYREGVTRFKRKVLGYFFDSQKLFKSEELVSKLVELKMFDSEEKAREILPYFNNLDLETNWKALPFQYCTGIGFNQVDSINDNKFWRIVSYHIP